MASVVEVLSRVLEWEKVCKLFSAVFVCEDDKKRDVVLFSVVEEELVETRSSPALLEVLVCVL